MSERLELRIEGVAHGGVCVARSDGQVVFCRHTAPGEVVVAEVSERRSRFIRAEAVEVLAASPDRVAHVWPAAGPGGVGGGELGHIALPAQQRWKAAVIEGTLRRIAHIERQVPVAPLSGDADRGGLGWRTRLVLSVDDAGRPGMHAPRSGQVVPLTRMPLAVAALADHDLFARRWPGIRRLWAGVGSNADPIVLADGAPTAGARWLDVTVPVHLPAGGEPRPAAGGEPGPTVGGGLRGGGADAPVAGVAQGVVDIAFRVPAGAFWQVHQSAPGALADAVLAAGAETLSRPGAIVWDLYAGVGLFSVPLAVAGARVWAVEADPLAGRAARRAAHGLPDLHLQPGDVEAEFGALPPPDLVVVDPPRRGAGRKVCAGIVQAGPGIVVYVACDPAALARDAATLIAGGYRMDEIVGLDMFPHTHHVECVAVFRRPAVAR
jgi:tRNA/tmRNA/rRNA uracil-C5-methylase (TrmA/RlmC/RlmD family)